MSIREAIFQEGNYSVWPVAPGDSCRFETAGDVTATIPLLLHSHTRQSKWHPTRVAVSPRHSTYDKWIYRNSK